MCSCQDCVSQDWRDGLRMPRRSGMTLVSHSHDLAHTTLSKRSRRTSRQAETDRLRADLEASREAGLADSEARTQLAADLSSQRRQVWSR